MSQSSSCSDKIKKISTFSFDTSVDFIISAMDLVKPLRIKVVKKYLPHKY